MFSFRLKYFLATLLLLLVEVCIALFVRDSFIRPYLGDVLVVILLYCSVMSFFRLRPFIAALGVLLFAFTIEMLQFLNAVDLLGLQGNRIAETLLGNHFDWKDMLAYVVGVAVVLLIEVLRGRNHSGRSGTFVENVNRDP